ncbi:MAG: deoxyribose-phosphate aldolase [Defluviitaleaceae bacterium]|nr:deoxyribose-phosphate aldolase [Defluviitaleaceae bacterium]
MEVSEILKMVDHTLLSPSSTSEQITSLCDDGINFKTASVCIPPSFVKLASKYVFGKIAVCTVIGFPSGYSTTKSKIFEASTAIEDGADEIDMVINIGRLKERKYNDVLSEIKKIKSECEGKLLKVIIEACLLTNDEKIKMCEIVTESGADYIKTSTGFSSGGATFEDIELLSKYIGKNVKIKASGGINNFEDAEKFIKLGAQRLGTSRLINIIKNNETEKGEY